MSNYYQLSKIGGVSYAAEGDFVYRNFTFEVGGKNKTVVADGIEIGHQHKIPLWLFGFLY